MEIEIIKSQTGIDDVDVIKKEYEKNYRSIPDTIMALMEYKYCKRAINTLKPKEPETLFDEIRAIVNEKEELYYRFMNNLKKEHLETISECENKEEK